jgi:hypothetical protein
MSFLENLSSGVRIPAENNSAGASLEVQKNGNRKRIGSHFDLADRGRRSSQPAWGTGGYQREGRGFTRASIDARNFGEFEFFGRQTRRGLLRQAIYCKFAYSALACFRIRMRGSVFPEGEEVLNGLRSEASQRRRATQGPALASHLRLEV